MGRRIWGWLPTIVLMGTIFYISSRPAPEIFRTQYIFSQDKFLHIGVYFALAVFFARAFIWEGKPWDRKWMWLAVALSALYGMTDEVHQAFVPERTSEIGDWIADVIGSLLLPALKRPLVALLHWEERLFKKI